MLTCPHCGDPGIPLWRKLSLGPAFPTTCRACGSRVGVPPSSMLALIPALTCVVASAFIPSLPLRMVLWWVGAALTAIVWMIWVPLERR